MKHVVIILLNWNGWRDTAACLDSLTALDYPDFEVLVVDNASTDGSVERLQAQFPELRIIVNDRNLGFAEGNNSGIRLALKENADFLWLLNNDTIADSGSLSALVRTADSPEVGAAGSKIYFAFPSQTLWFAGAQYRLRFGQAVMPDYGQTDDGVRWEQITDTDWITGCSLLVKAAVFRQIGLLDSGFFYGMEDVDFGLRVRAAGLRCVVAPQSKVWHKVSASSGGASSPLVMYYSSRNRLQAMKKHGYLRDWPLFLLHFAASQLVQTGLLSLLGRQSPAVFRAAILGTVDFLRGERGPMSERVKARLTEKTPARETPRESLLG